jgi:hypothetical protein
VDASELSPEGEVVTRIRLSDGFSVFASLVHSEETIDLATLRGPELYESQLLPLPPDQSLFRDNTIELGLEATGAWLSAQGVLWGSSRSGEVTAAVLTGDPLARRQWVRGPVEQALGAEARARLTGAIDGLAVDATAAVVAVDQGVLFDEAATPKGGVLNPLTTLLVHYAVPGTPVAMFARARGVLPQARLSPAEELDPTLCPEQPDPEAATAGAVRLVPCSGAAGGLLLDVGASLTAGRFRFDLVGQNLLDRQTRVRNEPLGSGGLGISALVSAGL